MTTPEVYRRHSFSEATSYQWKSRCGGLEVSEATQSRVLEDEHGKLKRMLADAMLGNTVAE